MTTVELVAAIGGGPTLTAAGVGVWKLAKMWLDARDRDAVRDDKREERTEKRLWTRLDEVEKDAKETRVRLDGCEKKHADCERTTGEQAAKIDDLEEKITELQGIAMRSDSTGQFRTELAAWASMPPPKPLDLPPPKRRKE